MQKAILVPTDFEVESLNTLKLALAQNPEKEVTAVLMYCEHLTTSITELLFYSRGKSISAMLKPEFTEALAIIKNKYPKAFINYKIELFHGYTVAAFKNFLEANKIEEIYIPRYYTFKAHANSYDPLPFIRKCNLPVLEMQWDRNVITYTKEQLGPLFSK